MNSVKLLFKDSHTIEWEYVRESNDSLYTVGLLVGDSRLWRMETFNWNDMPLSRIHVIAIRGAEVQALERSIMRAIYKHDSKCITVKLCLGVNNILNGDSPQIVFDHLKDLKSSILRNCSRALVSFSDIAQVNFDMSTRSQHFTTYQANARIDTLNGLIHAENKVICPPFLRGGSTCFLSMTVAREIQRRDRRRGIRYTVFHRNDAQLRDGIHVTDACKKKWVRIFNRSFQIDLNTFTQIFN